ncbi:MAG TPA: hypothetical protein VL201_01615, partial [Patescibacteria group bacterium]|nr:hypothetical protein [Patescibacteria group bacterium]
MFKKIVFYLLVATSLYVVAMEDKEITLASDYSNWRKVFELYKISIPKTQNYIEKNGEGNLYAYWVDELLTLKSPKNLSQEMFNKVVFLKITCDIFPSYKKIGYFSEDNQFSPWLHITDIDQLNAFGNMVCNNSSSNYFYLIVGTQLHFFYDPFALWYMRIRDLDKRKEYVTNYSTFLNMQALDVPKVQKNFFNIGALPVRAIRKYFMDPNGFFNNVMVPVCKNDPQLKSNFLSKFVDSFLSMYNPEKQGIRTFIYAYCSFFNHIFHIVTSEEIRQNLKEIANKFPGQTEKVLENSDLFLLYDKNDIISILYLTGGLEGVKTKEIRKNDALAWMKKFASAKEDNDDLKSVLVIIIAHCIPSLLDLYEGDPIGLKEFLETIGNQDYKKEMEKAVIEKPDEKNKMIQKEDPNFFEKPIPIEIRSGSLGLAEKIRDSKNNPNPLDKLLSQEFSDRQIRKEYKEVVLSVAKVESSVYFANMKYLFDLAKTKTVSGKKVMSEDDIKLMLAYWMNSAAIQSDQSIGNIKVIAQFLNENILDLNLKEELANILCVPGTNYYWFWDNKKIVIDHSIFMSAPTSPDEKAKRIAFMRNYVLFNNDDNIRKRFSDSAGFVKALNELKLTDDQLKQFLTEYIQSFLAYHEKSFVFGYAKFFSDLIINSSFRFTYQDQENLFEPFLKTAQLLYRDGTSNQPEILQDPRDFLSFVSGKSHDLSRDIEDFLMAVAKNDVYKKQFSDLFFSENIDREDLSYRVNKLISFLYAHKAEDKLQYINAFLKIYAFKRYDGLYKSFFHAIQRALKDTFNCNAEYKVIRDGKNLSHVQFTLKSDSNNELF